MKSDVLRAIEKDSIPKFAKQLSAVDIAFLVQNLNEKDDILRYNAFLLLQASSIELPFVYEYWSELYEKLENSNSYQRSIGLMLLAENVRWDKECKFKAVIARYLTCCSDEKFITARQAVQGLAKILQATDRYDNLIKQKLTNLQLAQYKMNQQRLLKRDLLKIFEILEKRSNLWKK